jgi:hypothetical protein
MAGKPFNKKETFAATMKEVNTVKREIAKKVIAVVVLSTPVGMPGTWQSPPPKGYTPGHARFSWQTSLDRPITFVKIKTSRLFQNIWFSNNAPYIGRLDQGWSRQAPANFVEKAILTGVRSLADTTIEVP